LLVLLPDKTEKKKFKKNPLNQLFVLLISCEQFFFFSFSGQILAMIFVGSGTYLLVVLLINSVSSFIKKIKKFNKILNIKKLIKN